MSPRAAPLAVLFFVLFLFLSPRTIALPISNNIFAQTGEESAFQEQFPSFESLPLEPEPGGNFSELAESDLPLGPAPPVNIPDINGTYINPDVGFQVDLPKGWSGKEITFLLDMVVAAPPGIEIESMEAEGTAMIIQVLDEESFGELARMPGGDPLAMQSGESDQCKELPASFVTINGLKAEQRSGDCTGEEGSDTKIKAYTFATADGTIILLAFSSDSINDYNRYLPQFEESVKTIRISHPGDVATSELYQKHKELEMQTQANMTMS
jgi:hypothetical protein